MPFLDSQSACGMRVARFLKAHSLFLVPSCDATLHLRLCSGAFDPRVPRPHSTASLCGGGGSSTCSPTMSHLAASCQANAHHHLPPRAPTRQVSCWQAQRCVAGSALSGGKSLSRALSQWPVRSTCGWVPSHGQGAFTVTLTLGRGHLQLRFKRAPSVMSCRSAVSCGLVPGWGPFRQRLAYAVYLALINVVPVIYEVQLEGGKG